MRLGADRPGAMIDTLFPDTVVTVEASESMWSEALHPEEALLVRKAVTRRRREFTAGRACARQALSRLGIGGFALLAGADRAPRWPVGIVGSISHCDGFCGAAVARREDLAGIGLDAEAGGPMECSLVTTTCTPAELERVSELPGASPAEWAKVIFSAKESTFKCYYPLARTLLELHDLEVTLLPASREFTARLVRADAPSANGYRRFRGRFERSARHVFTGVTLMGRESGTESPASREAGAPGDPHD